MTVVPHFAIPFRFSTPHAQEVEQDTQDEIAQCCEAVLRYPLDYRPELPEFGCPETAFQMEPLDLTTMQTQLDRWEPRAQSLVDEQDFDLDQLAASILITLGGQP